MIDGGEELYFLQPFSSATMSAVQQRIADIGELLYVRTKLIPHIKMCGMSLQFTVHSDFDSAVTC